MSFSLNLMNPRNNEYDVSVMASSSSSPAPRNSNKYDVFLSFRGEDTRYNFTSHLYSALCHNKIETFIDNDLKRGDEISLSLLDTIEASIISIIIFSEGYASSRWCLDELLKILECKRNYGQIVIPVFYRVDPSHVRKQIGSFGDSFWMLGERFPISKMLSWRSALKEAANLSGFVSRVIGPDPESKLVEEIANEILERLEGTFQSYNKDLVGVERRIKDIESLLCTASAGVYILGIWGIGGIGKTTIASAVFNRISRHFEGSYFAQNVRGAEAGGIKDLQKELLSKLLNDRNVRNMECQLNRLARKKVLIVFDDVTHPRQIESLIRLRLHRLASGSRVIITTRDKQVLENCWVNQIYQMKELLYADAHKLFCQCAFGGDHPDASHTELTDKAIKYARGVPLALKVLGRHLCGRSEEEWESAMRKLEVIPDKEIQEVLKISYDSLDDSQKNVFLDIACFLEGEHRDEVTSFFDARGFQAKIELSVLEGKSLITRFHNYIRMHDLIRDMGREIVRNESIDHPGERSRLWYHEDIYEVLKNNTGTEKIKGIFLDMNKVTREIHMNSDAFSKMRNLRFLRIYGDENKCMISHLEGVPFAEVRHLEWAHCPLKTLNICARKLVSLRMPCSRVEQLWDDVQDLVNLKEIDLSGSMWLTKLPDLSQAKNLKILMLGGCSSLMETRSSIQYLNKLEVLYLGKCESLTSLPISIPFKDLINFPNVTYCHVHTLELVKVGIKKLPSSVIECLSNLKKLYIVDCSQLESMSSSIFKLKSVQSIEISNCSIFKRFTEIPSCNRDGGIGNERLPSCKLETLIVDGTAMRGAPESLGQLSSLKHLVLSGNNSMRIPESLGQLSSLEYLVLSSNNLMIIPESLGRLSSLEYLVLSSNDLMIMPETLFELTSLERLVRIKTETLLQLLSDLSPVPLARKCKCLQLVSIPECLGELFKWLDELSSLEYLQLPGNSFNIILESLAQLLSPTPLVLSRNNSGSMPECLSQLSSLEYLQLSGNRLEGIPRYLKSFPSKLTSLNLSIDLKNCLKLDPNKLIEIVKDDWMMQSLGVNVAKSMYFPGNEIPKWFKYRSMGSSVTLQTPRADFLNNKILLGFAFCIVVAFRASDFFEHQIPRKSRPSVFGNYEVFCDWKHKSQGNSDRRSLGRISYVESDHVFLGYYLLGSEDLSKRDDGEVSFYISTMYDEDCEVKQCGIHFVYDEDCEVKQCGIHSVYAQDSTDKVNRKRKGEEERKRVRKRNHTPKD